MQFRHPELLYALFLLLIPIIIHLFQLRKFKKEAFTNVAFLKKINIQTRKSSTIKKWLILFTRMALIACIVIAFAQPFTTQSDAATKVKEYVIYLDNSFSMQAKGPSGQLFKTALQDLIKFIPEEQPFTLLTNDNVYRNITIKGNKKELLQLTYSANQLSNNALVLKAQRSYIDDPSIEKRFIIASDFQNRGDIFQNSLEDIETHYVQLKPVVANNISIDSVYVTEGKTNSLLLTAIIKTLEKRETNIPVSLYNKDTLVAKGTAIFKDQLTTEVTFEINTDIDLEGRLVIEDPLLLFDNTLYFSINRNNPIKVLAVNGAPSDYLRRIFTQPEFDFTSISEKDLDFSSLPTYNYIVLNELDELRPSLVGALDAFAKAGGTITIVLNTESAINAYNGALENLGGFTIAAVNKNKRLITSINYDHPIYNDVFDARIENFQYPSVSSSFSVKGGDPILSFENGDPFLTSSNGIFLITGSISESNSNFKNAPIIVPTFYNMSRQGLKLPTLYYTIGESVSYDVAVSLQEDEILKIVDARDASNALIPLQQRKGKKVEITTSTDPTKASNYTINYNDTPIQQVSYNYDRAESNLNYISLESTNDAIISPSIEQLFEDFKTDDSIESLWKWFIIFALFFMLLEILILKFYK